MAYIQFVATFLWLFVLAGCNPDELDEKSLRSKYEIPLAFEPDIGRLTDSGDALYIDAAEFGFFLYESVLAGGVEGFIAGHYGVKQDTMSIVDVYDPAIHDNWEPTETIIAGWNSIWHMTDGFEKACIGPDPDELTGYYRYYVYCDPAPSEIGQFFLMDRVPDSKLPRPSNQNYIKGSCRIRKNGVRPDLGPYHQCRFLRRTSWGDRFSFRLQGENVRLLKEVEQFIAVKLEEWRVDPELDRAL